MKVEELLSNWEKDSKMDKNKLGEEALKTDELHFKYTRMIIEENVRLAKVKNKYNEKYKDLWVFYTQTVGKATNDINTITKSPGGRIMNNQAEMHIQADEDFQQVSLEVSLQTEICNALKSIIWSITKRNDTIKSYITWEKFIGGN